MGFGKVVGKAVYLGVAFLLLYTPFITVQSLLTTRYGAQGYYVYAAMYLPYALSSLFAPWIGQYLGMKTCFLVGASAYFAWLLALNLADRVFFVALLGAALNGLGAGLLWVYQGVYINRLFTLLTDRRRQAGTISAVFYALYHLNLLLGSALAVALLQGGLSYEMTLGAFTLTGGVAWSLFWGLPTPETDSFWGGGCWMLNDTLLVTLHEKSPGRMVRQLSGRFLDFEETSSDQESDEDFPPPPPTNVADLEAQPLLAEDNMAGGTGLNVVSAELCSDGDRIEGEHSFPETTAIFLRIDHSDPGFSQLRKPGSAATDVQEERPLTSALQTIVGGELIRLQPRTRQVQFQEQVTVIPIPDREALAEMMSEVVVEMTLRRYFQAVWQLAIQKGLWLLLPKVLVISFLMIFNYAVLPAAYGQGHLQHTAELLFLYGVAASISAVVWARCHTCLSLRILNGLTHGLIIAQAVWAMVLFRMEANRYWLLGVAILGGFSENAVVSTINVTISRRFKGGEVAVAYALYRMIYCLGVVLAASLHLAIESNFIAAGMVGGLSLVAGAAYGGYLYLV